MSEKFNTEWNHLDPNLPEDQAKVLNGAIKAISDELEVASDLIFHTVILTNDVNSPIVMIDGRDDVKDTLYLTYYETPEWVSISEVHDED